eukprot:COSAG06_NODE_477_length_15216_cov_133.572402_9_plen_121_part_00
MCFTIGVSEHVRAQVETFGRVELSLAELTALAQTKPLHVAMIVLYVLFDCVLARNRAISLQVVLLLPFVAFWICGCVEAVLEADSIKSAARRALVVTFSAMGGFILFLILLTVFLHPENE